MSFSERVNQEKTRIAEEEAQRLASKALELVTIEQSVVQYALSEAARREAIEADPRWQEMMAIAQSPILDEALRGIWAVNFPPQTFTHHRTRRAFLRTMHEDVVTVIPTPAFNKVIKADYSESPNEPVGRISVEVMNDNIGMQLEITWRTEATKKFAGDASRAYSPAKSGLTFYTKERITIGEDRAAGLCIEVDNRPYYSVEAVYAYFVSLAAQNRKFLNVPDSTPVDILL